ncbi:MAG: hypothetical protein QS2022_5630 [Candidatus Phytoplasma asteris]|nr:MAG: hypothetical protein QS2022_5630 [Candidatus Phytoplasma asteris]
MSKNNSNKTDIIIWGFLFSIAVIFLSFLLSLSFKSDKTNNQGCEPPNPENPQSTQQTPLVSEPTRKEIIYWKKDDKTIYSIKEYKPKTDKLVKCTYYNEDGKTINYIAEYYPQTGKEIKTINYSKDGTIKYICEIIINKQTFLQSNNNDCFEDDDNKIEQLKEEITIKNE